LSKQLYIAALFLTLAQAGEALCCVAPGQFQGQQQAWASPQAQAKKVSPNNEAWLNLLADLYSQQQVVKFLPDYLSATAFESQQRLFNQHAVCTLATIQYKFSKRNIFPHQPYWARPPC
jgi:hypothetical protein